MESKCEGQAGVLLSWLKTRVREPSTWVGLSMIAVAMGSDPMQAEGVAQAISLIVGGGLVATTRLKKSATSDVEPRR